MKRILIKLSGECLSNKDKSLLVDSQILSNLVHQIKELLKEKIQVGIVIGGGNFWRGVSAVKNGISRNRADYIGMLATIMNGLALISVFEKYDIKAKMQSSIVIDPKVSQNYVKEKAVASLEKGEVVIFTGGIGRPYFTTDTAAILVAIEIHALEIWMGKNGVKGIYESNPKIHPNSKKYGKITYDELIQKKLEVMDITAVSLAQENNIKLLVFDIKEPNALVRIWKKDIEYTEVVK